MQAIPAEGYKYFNSDQLHDIFEFSKELSGYLERESVKSVLFLDRAARPAWVGVDEFWNQNIKDKPKPGFYFMNANGAHVYDEDGKVTNARELFTLLEHFFKSGSIPQREERVLNELSSRFRDVYPTLVENLNDPLVVFDTCSHSGITMESVITLLKHVGFSDIRPITANEPEWQSPIEAATVIDNETRLLSCYPFGEHSLVEKTDDIIAAPNRKNLEMATRIREDIRQVMQSGGV